ncbi:hypothetical protein ACN9MF_20420 [Methylobacterium fujisawaense]|uniref:hypothetical protein n=1 Tax=Methylobacterium fujisawaense TaxID=107400 RepID=UPI003CF7ABBF
MEQARPDSTVLPAAQIDAGHGCDGSHDRDERITRLLTARPTAPLPEPGSAEAKAAWRAACHEHTIRTQFANEYPELKRTPLEWWTFDTISKALETGELTPAECARLYPMATERELLMAQIEHELNLAGLFALAYAEHYPVAISDADPDATEEETGSDADLLSLGRRFEDASARETAANEACNAAEASRRRGEPIPKALDDAANEAGDITADLAHRIAALQAQTAAGLRVKLRALAHYNASLFCLTLPELPDPDQALSHSLWRDVEAGSGSETSTLPDGSDADADTVPASVDSGPDHSTRGALSPDRAWAVTQAAAIDLSGLTILELNNLYDRFNGIADGWLAVGSQSWAKATPDNPFHAPSAGGRIVDREQDRAGEIRNRIAEEIRQRAPADDLERNMRLETLIQFELLCEISLKHNPELRAEIAQAWGA